MSMPTPLQQQRIERIAAELNNYLNARAEHAIRVNPSIRNVFGDMVFQHMQRVRTALAIERIFSQNRFMVCDILISGDEKKKTDLVVPNSQNCIMPMLVKDLSDDVKQKQDHGRLQVHDLRSLYAALDPQLNRVMELIEIWAWWDLPSAGYLAFFYTEKEQLEQLIAQGFSARKEINRWLRDAPPELKLEESNERGGATVAPGEAAGRHFMSMTRARNHFHQIEEKSESYKMILKRAHRAEDSSTLHNLLIEAGRRYLALDRIHEHNALDDQLKQYYSKILQCPPEQLRTAQVIELEREKIQQLLPKLTQELESHSQQGEPFDYKMNQLTAMDEALEQLRKPLGIDEAYHAVEDEEIHGDARELLSTQDELAAMQDESEQNTPFAAEEYEPAEDEPGPLGF